MRYFKQIFGLPLLFWAAAAFAQNPYLPLWEHVPDGEPRVFDDPDQPGKQRVYIIGSHDTQRKKYCGIDTHMWSAPVEDLSQWRDEGAIFTYFTGGKWDIMYAPDLVEVKDKSGKKTYWLYPHSRGDGRVGMVCRSDRPNGPFVPVNLEADGQQCLSGSRIDFDPAAYIEYVTDKNDPDYERGFRAYAYYGFKGSKAFELDPDKMYAKRQGKKRLDPFLTDEFQFFEASSLRKVGNKYVFIYSGYSGSEYGLNNSNSTLRYAYGDTPVGPWKQGGVLVDSRGVVPNEDGSRLIGSNAAHNTHGSILEINGQWYVFYHRPPRSFGYARQGMVAPVEVKWDEKSVADGGKVYITACAPFKCKAGGHEYTGAEVTSEGFQIFGLPPYRFYSAGIACYMSDNSWIEDNYDVWRDGMTLAGIKSGGIVGFKYFGFGGLSKDQKGVRAFQGIRKGDRPQLSLFLTPRTGEAFRIRVMLDGPYQNKIWQGREVAVIDVPANAPKRMSSYQVDVPAIEGLQGKHAIYLVVEGEGDKPLCDLYGLGFSRQGEPCTYPVVPTITITADGQSLSIPSEPLSATTENGLTENNRYQVYGPLNAKTVLQARTDNPEVKIEVSPIVDGRATVRCIYQGKVKIYQIN